MVHGMHMHNYYQDRERETHTHTYIHAHIHELSVISIGSSKEDDSTISLAKGQLSRQYHYDFGLRALKAVLVMAGELIREDHLIYKK